MAASINLDLRNPVGWPVDVAALAGFRAARFVFNVGNRQNSTDEEAAHRLYGPYVHALTNAGIRPLIVFTHESGLEGQGFDWKAMSPARWIEFGARLAAIAGRVAARYAGRGIVYQVHNQQDTDALSDTVGIPAVSYGEVFRRVQTAIRAADSSAIVITGGYVTGPGSGMAHFRASNINPDGVAFHPYLASAGGLYANDGVPPINAQIAEWRRLGKPLYITEFGVLDKPNEPDNRVSEYARAFLAATPDVMSGACWYAWRDGMHNGYGVLRANGAIRPLLMKVLTAGGAATPADGYPAGDYQLNSATPVNLRAAPSTNAAIVRSIPAGSRVTVIASAAVSDGKYVWQEVVVGSDRAHMATKGGAWTLVPVGAAPDVRGLLMDVRASIDAALAKL